MLEIETKIIGINVIEVKNALRAKKAKFAGSSFFRRWVFDLSPNSSFDEYIRVRTDGKKATLTYKLRKGKGLRNTNEIETDIGDFDKASVILSKIIKKRYYQENVRHTYEYKDLEITINKWPGIPAYVEIEGPSSKKVNQCVKELGIKGKNIGNVNIAKVYQNYGKSIKGPYSLKK